MKMTGSRTRGVSIGPTKGLTVTSPSGGVRLMMPGENGGAASIYRDEYNRDAFSFCLAICPSR